jgi:hypothetical protein
MYARANSLVHCLKFEIRPVPNAGEGQTGHSKGVGGELPVEKWRRSERLLSRFAM